MSTECLSAVEAARIRDAVKERYAAISSEPLAGQIPYPTGRESLARLGYRPEWLAGIPPRVLERFIGIGNPFGIRPVKKGERVLDLGCGCGLDAFVAASLVGPTGKVVGIDLTPQMLEWARKAQEEIRAENVRFVEGDVEALPFEDESFDLAISNGVLNLVPNKDAAFREIARVLRDDGDFVAADIIVMETIPEDVLKSVDAWSA
jgi:SAM-dependent methyltransferase